MMAERVIKVCDNCGKQETKNVKVYRIDTKWSDGTRTVGDLCTECRKRLVKDFGLTHTLKQRRADYKVVNYEDIPGV